MKQFNYKIKTIAEAKEALNSLNNELASTNYKSLLFHLYTIQFNDQEINKTQEMILELFSDAKIVGTSTNGDICDGHLAEYGLIMCVSVFESTETVTYIFPCDKGKEAEIGRSICETIDSNPEIKAAEILITLKSINSHIILNEVEKCNKNVYIFGGGSAAMEISGDDTKVFNNNQISHAGVMLVTYSGEDFHIDVHHAIGWKPLGKDFEVTKIDGKRLYELNHKPAGQIYSRYLDIQPDCSCSRLLL